MCMGENEINASEIVNNYTEEKIANIIFKYGEEQLSRRIAKNIIFARKTKLIKNTKELVDIIKKSFPI